MKKLEICEIEEKDEFLPQICEEIEIDKIRIFGVETVKTKEICYCFNNIKKINDVIECVAKAKKKFNTDDIVGYYELKSGVLFFMRKPIDK